MAERIRDTETNRIRKALAPSDGILRFYDHGSGNQRVAYVEVGTKATKEDEFKFESQMGINAFYRLRKSGEITLKYPQGDYDYYGF